MKTYYCFDFSGYLLFSGSIKELKAKTGIKLTAQIYKSIKNKSIVWHKYYFSDRPVINIHKAKLDHNPLFKKSIDQVKSRYENRESVEIVSENNESLGLLNIKTLVCLIAADVHIKLLMNKDQITYKKKLFSGDEIISQLGKTSVNILRVLQSQGIDIDNYLEIKNIPTI